MGDAGLPQDGLDMQKIILDSSQSGLKETPMTGEDYAKKVEGWGIFGYHPGLKINNIEYSAETSFYSSGDNIDLLDEAAGGEVKAMQNLATLINSNWQFGREGFENPSVNMIFATTEVGLKFKDKYPDKKIIQIVVFHDNRVSNSGRADSDKCVSLIGLLVPSRVADELEEQVPDNPDIVNELLVKSLPGLDSTSEHEGLERYKATNLTLIPKNKLAEAVSGQVNLFDRYQLPKFISTCQKIPFKNGPYGVKDYVR